MALVTTISGTDSDSYVTVAEYMAYHQRFYSRNLTDDDMTFEGFLRRATLLLDFNYKWKGIRSDENQSREWPRRADIFDVVHGFEVEGYFIDTDEIPERIKTAQMEIAYHLSQGTDLTPILQDGLVESETVRAGPVSVSTRYRQIHPVPKIPLVDTLISPYHNGSKFSSISTSRISIS